jgi:ABC-type multidrug transport system fused ATPase/permease subunit
MSVWRLAWRVSQHEPRSFWSGYLLFVLFFTFPVLTGWLLGRGFSALSTGDNTRVYWIAVALALCEIARMSTIHAGALMWTRAWVHMQSLLRANLLAAQVASGGPEAGQPVGSAGEAITHFRDDVEDVTMFVDGFVDVSAGVVFTVLAGLVLGSIDSNAAMMLLIPLIGVAVATRSLDGRIKRYRAADRAAASRVSGLLGDVMAAPPPSRSTMRSNRRSLTSNDWSMSDAARLLHRARRKRLGLQPGCCRCRPGPGPVVDGRRNGVGAVQRGRTGRLLRVPRMVELSAEDGGADAGPPKAGRSRL